MTEKEVNRCCVVRETIRGGLTVKEAAIMLILSDRRFFEETGHEAEEESQG